MQLDKTRAILLGILTFLPHVFGIVALLRVLAFILSYRADAADITIPSVSSLLFGSAFTWLLSMALIVFYLVHLYQAKEMDTEKKWLWAAVLVFAGYVSMPFYWWYKIWKPVAGRDRESSPEGPVSVAPGDPRTENLETPGRPRVYKL